MSIVNVYVDKVGKATWIEMDTFILVGTCGVDTKGKYLRLC